MPPFSERQGFAQPKGIRYREDVPKALRRPILNLAVHRTGRAWLEKIVGWVLDPYGIEAKPLRPIKPVRSMVALDGLDAVREAIDECPWFRVYDVVEAVFKNLALPVQTEDGQIVRDQAPQFESEINEYFAYAEIGWQLRNGVIITRGDEAFENSVNSAVKALEQDEKPTAAGHLRFAVNALSARPKANTSGAVTHATSAVECVLGEITGAPMGLGDYLKRNPQLFHAALKKGLEGIYGYASDEGARHGKEGTERTRDDADFVVATCAAVCTLLIRKHPK